MPEPFSLSVLEINWQQGGAALIGVAVPILLYLGSRCLLQRRLAASLAGPRPPIQRASAPSAPVSLRRSGSPVAVLIRGADAAGDVLIGRVIERSLEGLCLEVDTEPAVCHGAVLEVRASHAPDSIPWVEVRVQAQRTRKDCWELDCPYLRTPSWSVRMLFG